MGGLGVTPAHGIRTPPPRIQTHRTVLLAPHHFSTAITVDSRGSTARLSSGTSEGHWILVHKYFTHYDTCSSNDMSFGCCLTFLTLPEIKLNTLFM